MSYCKIDNCEKKRSCQGYCNKHYLRWLRHGDALYRSKVAKNEWHGVTCKILHCESKVKCKGLCKLHYQRYQRGTL